MRQKFLNGETNNFTNQKPSFGHYEDAITQPLKYYESLPSKGIRVKVARMFNHWYQLGEDSFQKLCNVTVKLHNASLIIDDIEDSSEKRRGMPAAYIKFGVPLSLNSANYAYFQALETILEEAEVPGSKRLEEIELFVNGMMLMHLAQGMEIYWRDQLLLSTHPNLQLVPTEDEYLNIIVKKTSHQFVLVSEFMKLRSSTIYATEERMDPSHLAELIGAHFQIRDDLLNLLSHKYEEGKGFCDDISEGKFSFPIICALNQLGKRDESGMKEGTRLMEIMRMQTDDRNLKCEAINIMEKCGALEYTRNVLKGYENSIGKEILRLGGNPVFAMTNLFQDDI